MSNVELTSEELRLLLEILESALSDLRMEIVDTDRSDYKDSLKQRRDLLTRLVEKLQGGGDT